MLRSWPVEGCEHGSERVLGTPEPIHLSEESPFRPCDRGLVEFFKGARWALFGTSIGMYFPQTRIRLPTIQALPMPTRTVSEVTTQSEQ